jgi:predicted homoserine dehydrogenase-like protein
MAPMAPIARVGIVGTGFIVRQALQVMRGHPRLAIGKILTRRPVDTVPDMDARQLTRSLDELVDHCDIVFESTGDPIHSTLVIERALRAGRKVVTMNAELHVTTGSYLSQLGYLSEAEGDQPGATALLRNEALAMGFEPLAYVNIKGFLNPNPTREDMLYWSERQKLSLVETTSFTDGTKLQIEQALCTNAFGAEIAQDGLVGGKVEDIFRTDHLAQRARAIGKPISDYVQCATAPPGVFILAEHPVRRSLPHYGPYEKLRTENDQAYLLLRPFHLCGLEVAKSLLAALDGRPPLLNNGSVPRISVAAVAKQGLAPGQHIEHAIGGFDVRGSAIRLASTPDRVPIGLLGGARVKRRIEPGQTILFDDVELPESRALSIWLEQLRPRLTTA